MSHLTDSCAKLRVIDINDNFKSFIGNKPYHLKIEIIKDITVTRCNERAPLLIGPMTGLFRIRYAAANTIAAKKQYKKFG